jgi:aryl-alcohol dehydrogenase-like predicted oxidoreductase
MNSPQSIQNAANVASVPLGNSDVRVSPLGIGTWAWGDRLVWGYSRSSDPDLQAAFQATLAAGINFLDSAEMYGFGRSEQLIGQFAHVDQQPAPPVLIATKFLPLPWRLRKASLLRALRGSLKRLQVPRVDLYQIHWPSPPVAIETWMDALADAVEAGLTRAVGVSNYNPDQMRRAHAALAKRGIMLASNQVEYSLLHRAPEHDGLLALCRELGVTLIAYSPLAKGLLTGKYTPDNPPKGARGRMAGRDYLTRIQPLIGQLRAIGEAHGGKTPAQVALNWLISKGALPIPGAKNVRQVQDNAGALGWRLTQDEVARLDAFAL